jgi:hypothetical protein
MEGSPLDRVEVRRALLATLRRSGQCGESPGEAMPGARRIEVKVLEAPGGKRRPYARRERAPRARQQAAGQSGSALRSGEGDPAGQGAAAIRWHWLGRQARVDSWLDPAGARAAAGPARHDHQYRQSSPAPPGNPGPHQTLARRQKAPITARPVQPVTGENYRVYFAPLLDAN